MISTCHGPILVIFLQWHLFPLWSSMILYVSITRIAIQSYSNHNSQIPRYLSIGWLWQTPAFRKHHCFCIVLTCLHIFLYFLAMWEFWREVVFCSSIAFSKSLQKFFYPNLGVLCLVEPYKSTPVGSAPRTPNGSPDCALLATENANGHPTEIVFWDHSVPSRFSSKHHCNLQRIPSTEILATKILV
jgi:hypothetical protein